MVGDMHEFGMPQFLVRESLISTEEINAIDRFFPLEFYHSEIKPGLVFGRYSVLPFYDWVATDLENIGGRLVNSYAQHRWIANFEYYAAIEKYTPKTWFNLTDFSDKDAPFVVKGKTNGRKHNWLKFMFATSAIDAREKACLLQEDSLIGQQDIIVRKYHELETFEIGINGLPITNEWRVFCYQGHILAYGYYWSIASNADAINRKGPGSGFIEFVEKVARICAAHAEFYVIDVAKTVYGEWIVIEMNDAQMSGLSMVEPIELYTNLYALLN